MFARRINEIRSHLEKQKLDAVLISDVSNITYLTGYANFSKEEREAYLFIGNDCQYIITDGRYSEAIKKEVPHFKLFERGVGKSTEEFFKKHKEKIKRLGIEEDNLTVSEHKILSKHFRKTKHFDVGNLRSIKVKEEIGRIEKACKIGDLAFRFILKKIKIGITEKQIAKELEDFIRNKGATISFPVIVAFGKNSSVPHHQTGDTILENRDGQFILLDFGVKFNDYCSDMARTVFFGGPTDQQKRIYKTVLEAQQKAVDFINSATRTGKRIRAAEVDKVARGYIVSKGYPTIPHSLGHGIGLEVHEHPSLSLRSKEELKQGMVFSIEPGIYLPNLGGVRIEDLFCISKTVPSETKGLFVLEKNGLRVLTRSPKELISVEPKIV